MKSIFAILANWIYKKKCYFCGKSIENTKMCSNCYSKIVFNDKATERSILGCKVFCACTYDGIIQKLIRGVKYHGQRELAFYLAKIMYEYWSMFNIDNNYTVIPVPLYKKREKIRKYNHMTLVAEEFCKLTGYNLNTEIIKRVKDTAPQYNLNRNQRIKNLEGAFKVRNNNDNKSLKILLIDDICTTGTTFEQIICKLQKAGYCDIICFAASTPKWDMNNQLYQL